MTKPDNQSLPGSFPVIIIGAGPAGLMAAISAQKTLPPDSVLLIEKGLKPGRKLLISAAGQCNITHSGTVEEILQRYNDKGRFLKPALYEWPPSKLIDFIESRGVPLFSDEKGRYLPRSLRAGDILSTVMSECRNTGVIIQTGDFVKEITLTKEEPEKVFSVRTENNLFSCSRLIITTGGKSFPKTGSEGDGYLFATSLGHTLIPPRPALTGISVKNFGLKQLAGISFDNITVSLFRNGKKKGDYNGDLLITHKGISGPVIINNSRDFYEGDILQINFTGYNENQLREILLKSAENEGSKTISTLLRSVGIPKKIIPFLFNENEKKISQLKKEERTRLITRLTAYPVPIDRIQGFDTAMVTTGGVETKEINPKTMESRLTKNLFFAGEVIDIDGDSGGYNIQAAFSTGFLAGKSAALSLSQ